MGVVKRKRKKCPFQATVWVAGVRVAIRSFETRSAAYSWHDETKRRFDLGYGPAGEMTFAEVIAAYRERSLPGLRLSSQRRRVSMLGLLAEGPLSDVQMADMTGARIDHLIEWLIKHPRAAEPGRHSFTNEAKMLGQLFRFYRETYDERFSCLVTRRHLKQALYKGSRVPKRKDFYLPVEDAGRWFAALARALDPVYHDLARFQVIMGTRIGETVALCWDAVDFDRGLIEIRRTMDWWGDNGGPKIENWTKTPSSQRTLPMPRQVVDILKAARARQPTSLVVFRNRFGRMVRYPTILNAYGLAFKQAGLPWTGSHICRDTNATLAIGEVRAEAVQLNLGHTSVRQTEVYAKANQVVANIVPATVARLLDRGKV